MPRPQRVLAHALAEQYGLASASQGADPRRAVELFKPGPGSAPAGLPARLLSRVAPTVGDEEVAALVRQAEGHPLRLADVAPTADLGYHLRRWEGGLRVEWEAGGEAAVVRFDREADRAEALDALGGGIRGLFRVDRGWAPRVAVAGRGGGGGGAAPAPWAPPPPAGGAGGGEQRAGGGAGAGAGSWTAVAVAPRPPPAPRAQQAEQAGQDKHALPTGWTVITGRRAAAAPSASELAADAYFPGDDGDGGDARSVDSGDSG
jgi:hypothetical protein